MSFNIRQTCVFLNLKFSTHLSRDCGSADPTDLPGSRTEILTISRRNSDHQETLLRQCGVYKHTAYSRVIRRIHRVPEMLTSHSVQQLPFRVDLILPVVRQPNLFIG